MSISLYDLCVPVLNRGLKNLSHLLEKGDAHARARNFDPAALLTSRIYPDMFAFVRQVQIACDVAKGAVSRLSGIDNPKHEDSEATFAELQTRIAKTLAHVNSVGPAQMQNAQERAIAIQLPSATLNFTGLSYLTDFVMPNFYFHSSMAYALLRHNGVEIGKSDFLGSIG